MNFLLVSSAPKRLVVALRVKSLLINKVGSANCQNPCKIKMQKTRKRKQLQLHGHSKTPKTITEESYPSHHRPTPEECRVVRDELLALHGFPPEFLKYRHQRLIKTESHINVAKSEPLNNNDDGEESVLAGPVKTVLSQNTTELNSQKAFASLKSTFPTFIFFSRFGLMGVYEFGAS